MRGIFVASFLACCAAEGGSNARKEDRSRLRGGNVDGDLNWMFNQCSANPACDALGLVGNCCPTGDGVTLDCCGQQDATPVPLPVPPPHPTPHPVQTPRSTPDLTQPPGSPAFCNANPACAALGLAGNCCPTGDGVFLDCCGQQADGSKPTTLPSPKATSPEPTNSPRQMTPYPATTVPNSSSAIQARLKLYWEEGYNWQDEDFERKWCLTYDYNGFPGTGRCWYEQKVLPCNPEEVYMSKCSSDPRQRLELVILPGNNEAEVFMIKLLGRNSCLQLDDGSKSIFLRTCDSQSTLQHWKATNGSLTGRRFEIVPFTLPSHCVTQDHHPKPGEVLRVYRCSLARSPDHLTSFWSLYNE